MIPVQPPRLLDTIPGGALLSRVLPLLARADRREEFIGDLIEEARRLSDRSPPWRIALWLWSQALRSAPALLAGRLRHPGGRPSLALSLALSLSAHALVLCLVVGWAFSRVEEIAPVPGRPSVPLLPSALIRRSTEQAMLTRVCVGSGGDVTSVDVLRGIDVLVDVPGHRRAAERSDSCYASRFLALR
jgi:hypothetical protein